MRVYVLYYSIYVFKNATQISDELEIFLNPANVNINFVSEISTELGNQSNSNNRLF